MKRPLLAADRVLDVGTASGNTALAAVRRRTHVTGVDITPAFGNGPSSGRPPRVWASTSNTGTQLALTFEDGSFDVVMSTFGAIFAPDSKKTAAEMARVCRGELQSMR